MLRVLDSRQVGPDVLLNVLEPPEKITVELKGGYLG